MTAPSGDDDTLASPDVQPHAETIASADVTVLSAVDLGSAQTIGSGGAPLSTTTHALPIVPFESYVRLDEYARGGLGRIIRAKDARTGRFVAIKEMLADNDDAAARFVREAMVTANLQHPAIVPVYEVGQWPDGKPFYAMKLVRGRALNEEIAATADLDGRLALVSYVAAVADALAYAHGENVIHRDLKPHNVLCGAFGETVVIDWGLARRLDESESVWANPSTSPAPGETRVGAVMGTPSYMPPEQARGERADHQSDVYAIGAILYHVLMGRPPHAGTDLETVLDRVQNATPDKLPSEVPPDLAAIVERAMARDREMRYPTAAELASDLRRFMTGQLVLAHHYTRRQRLARFVVRNRVGVAIAGAALAIVAIVATFAIRNILIARGEAAASRDEARGRLVASYIDRAGLELVSGQPARSLAYTIASAQVAGLTPQTRLLAAHALDQVPPLHWWRDAKGTFAMFVPGSRDLLLPIAEEIVRWSPDTDQVRWRAPRPQGGDVKLVGRDALAFARDNSVALVAHADGGSITELKGSEGAHYGGLLGMDEGARWLAATADDRIDLFDLTTRALVASIPFAKAVRAPRIAADGEHILAVSTPPAMSVLDRSGTVVATFNAGPAVVTAGDELVYAPPLGENGIAHLIVGDWTGTVRLDLPIGNSPINAVAVDVTANRIALGTEDGVVQIRSLQSGAVSWQASLGDRAGFVVFDGNVLRVVSSSAVVGFDIMSGFAVERVSVSGGVLLAASDDHARVATVVFGAGFAVWAPARGELMPVAPTPATVSNLAFAPDGTVISAGDDGEIHMLRDGQPIRRIGTGPPINTVARLDNGTLITASPDGTIIVRDRDGAELRRFAGGVTATPSPDGRQIATATANGTVAIWDPATGTSVRVLGKLANVYALRWSPDGRRIAAASSLGDVSVWDATSGTLVRKVPEGNRAPATIALSNDANWLARGGEPADTLFALDGGSDRKLLEARPGTALVVAFSPDDKTVLVAGMGFLSTWDIATAAPRLSIATNGWITSAAFLDHGKYIIGGGTDRRVHVWNAESGAELLAFTVPTLPRRIVVENSGSRVAVLAGRGAIVWTVPTFAGTLADLHDRVRCRLDLEVVDAHLRAHSIDIAACNRVAW